MVVLVEPVRLALDAAFSGAGQGRSVTLVLTRNQKPESFAEFFKFRTWTLGCRAHVLDT